MAVAKHLLTGNAFAFESITVDDSVNSFTPASYNSDTAHKRAIVTATGGVMRYRYDGGNPSATVGHLLSHGDTIIIEGTTNIANFKAIRAGTQNGGLSVTYEAVY